MGSQRPSLKFQFGSLGFALFLAFAGTALSADERGLWKVWKLHSDSPDDHAGVVAACDDFAKRAPDDPLVVIASSLAGWHQLKQGKPAAARERFEALVELDGTPLERAASDIARAWLTRLDVPVLRAALKSYYLDNVGFPETLEALRTLPDSETLPLTDRWGRPWSYRLSGFRLLRGMSNQRYKLGCVRLGATLDLERALAMPYGDGIGLIPLDVVLEGHTPTVRFKQRGARDGTPPFQLPAGRRHGRTSFAWMGERLVVLADVDHWQLLPKPK